VRAPVASDFVSDPQMETVMRRFVAFAALTALTCLAALVHAADIAPGPYYARGNFYSAVGSPGSNPDGTWGYSPEQQMFDDGLHGDGAANDGVYGVDIACSFAWGLFEFKIANADWTFNAPNEPGYPMQNGYLWTDWPGQVLHFTLDTSPSVGGWQPDLSVANSAGYPTGMGLEVIGSAPEIGSWNWGVPADHIGKAWSKSVVIAMPGAYEFKFRCLGTWAFANFGIRYNNVVGANASFVTTMPNEPILFQFDETNGRLRAVHDDPTPVRRGSWGQLKAAYR
jgi:hypothetical protein